MTADNLKRGGLINLPPIRAFPLSFDDGARAELRAQLEAKEGDILTMDVPIASDEPLYRYGYYEVLNMDGVDLSWARSGNAAMQAYSHDAVDRFGKEGHAGNFDNARIVSASDGQRKQVVVRAIFYRNDPVGMDLANNIAMGKMRNVSVEYRLKDPDGYSVQRIGKPDGDYDMRVSLDNWEITGFAWLTSPADKNYAGLGRKGDGAGISIQIPNDGDRTMTAKVKPEAAPAKEAERKEDAVTPAVNAEGARSDKPAEQAAPAVAPEGERKEDAPAVKPEAEVRAEAKDAGLDYAQLNDFMRGVASLDENARNDLWARCLKEKWKGERMASEILSAASRKDVPQTEGGRAVNIVKTLGDNLAVARKLAEVGERGSGSINLYPRHAGSQTLLS